MPTPPSGLTALLTEKCPRCRKGNMYMTGPYNLGSFQKMHENCPHCGFHFEIETGFFWGAMYINYGFIVGLLLTVVVPLRLLTNWDLLAIMGLYITLIVVLLPLLTRYSRVLMLHLFGNVQFDPACYQQAPVSQQKAA